MIISERMLFGNSYGGQWLLGDDGGGDGSTPSDGSSSDGGNGGGGSGMPSLSDVGGALSKVGGIVSAGKKIVGQVTGKGGAGAATGAKLPAKGTFVLAPGADWKKVKVMIAMPLCADQYKALVAEYKRRTSSQVYANQVAKIKAGKPLSQSDLNGLEWVRVAQGRINDFQAMYTMQPKYWPTKCPKGSGTGIPGYKAGVLGTGVSMKYAYAGIGALALAGVAVWLLK